MQQTPITFTNQFEEDVYKGLTDFPKHLSSKYFYDTKGDKLFQRIMNMPEYYLTDSEHEVLNTYKHEITNWFCDGNPEFNLIELGAGDGKKTRILLNHMSQRRLNFTYTPIDISHSVLDELLETLHEELPGVPVEPVQGTYFEALNKVNTLKHSKKVILFLGSNIGNLLHPQAVEFLVRIRNLMGPQDLLFIGFDQKKHPQTVLDAYNDKTGITEAFNKNVLTRINGELGANFDPEKFLHWEVYDPETGTAKSYLVSQNEQSVYIQSLDMEVSFKKWETIHTEISQKYDDEVVSWLAREAGLQVEEEFTDSQGYYKNYVFSRLS